jgi:hypothetical protein
MRQGQQSNHIVTKTGVARIGRRLGLAGLLAIAGMLTGSPALAQARAPVDPLTRAHQFYNRREFQQAIEAASEARQQPAQVDAASVVFARAHLELYQEAKEPAHLDAARDALVHADDAKLSPRDHVELLVGFGELVYFDGRYGAAAAFFEIALGRAELLEPGAGDRLFEWWANSLDQEAQHGLESQRQPLYARILERAREALRHDDRSAVASYWIVVAERGTNDLDAAWGAAEAGWIRAPFFGAAGEKLRADLDRLVVLVLIPERARQLSANADPRPAMARLQEQWDAMKAEYKKAGGV